MPLAGSGVGHEVDDRLNEFEDLVFVDVQGGGSPIPRDFEEEDR